MKRAPVLIALGVIWEGSHVKTHNIQAIRDFRKQFHGVNLIHFMNPAYFLRTGQENELIKAKMESVIEAEDDIGLSLYSWKSVVEKSGVIFRRSPTLWGNTLDEKSCRRNDCGVEVPLASYPLVDIQAIIRKSVEVLTEEGFARPTVSYAGGWITSRELFEAARANGIRYDFSSVDPKAIDKRFKYYPARHWIASLWTEDQSDAIPSRIATRSGSVVEIANPIGSLEQTSKEDVMTAFSRVLERHKRRPKQQLIFPILFHQESAYTVLPVLSDVMDTIFAMAKEKGVPLRPLELPEDQEQLVKQSSEGSSARSTKMEW